ncbi:MAG: type II toxin-antitoxin system RelE/ParE family toxin [Lachnospiraceae bacterium]|nr:type II toxin-antitoxin system RelE/ParE family toxin [Lachnospiraceae bacterium]
MINSFSGKETELIFQGVKSTKLPSDIQNTARRKLRMIAAAKTIDDLRIPPGNRLERLKGNLSDYWSIRINDQWRIVFLYENGGAYDVRITDYH